MKNRAVKSLLYFCVQLSLYLNPNVVVQFKSIHSNFLLLGVFVKSRVLLVVICHRCRAEEAVIWISKVETNLYRDLDD